MSDEAAIILSGPLKGYFFGLSFRKQGADASGLSGFAFPDLGILFKCRYQGQLHECQYEGLLALLRFTAENPGIFAKVDLDLFTDSALINYQMNHRRPVSGRLKRYRDKAFSYRRNIRYRVGWVPFAENLAIAGYDDMITISPEGDFEIDGSRIMGKGFPRTGENDSSE